MEVNRRKFLASSASAAMVAGTMLKGKAYGANDRVGICCIGINGRGGEHIDQFGRIEGAEIVALCDADERVLNPKAREYQRVVLGRVSWNKYVNKTRGREQNRICGDVRVVIPNPARPKAGCMCNQRDERENGRGSKRLGVGDGACTAHTGTLPTLQRPRTMFHVEHAGLQPP